MPNVYATPTEIKAALPQAIRTATTTYDAELSRLSDTVSRLVDNLTHREFFPRVATRYFRGKNTPVLSVDYLLSITSVSISTDDGDTFTALAASDYFTSCGGDQNAMSSWTHLHIDPRSDTWATWPSTHNAVKIVGVWAYADDRDAAWESSLDTVQANPLTSGATACAVNDDDGADLNGFTPRFQAGQLLRMESEIVSCSAAAANSLTIARGRNGSTAAAHVQNTAIDIWRPPAPVKQAVITQIARVFMRALQAYGDGRATPDVSQILWVRSLDPDVVTLLAAYTDPVSA